VRVYDLAEFLLQELHRGFRIHTWRMA
jgi:hypothetical protein